MLLSLEAPGADISIAQSLDERAAPDVLVLPGFLDLLTGRGGRLDFRFCYRKDQKMSGTKCVGMW